MHAWAIPGVTLRFHIAAAVAVEDWWMLMLVASPVMHRDD